MTKIDQLAARLSDLHLEMERRFGHITTALFLIGAAVIFAMAPQSLMAQFLLGVLR